MGTVAPNQQDGHRGGRPVRGERAWPRHMAGAAQLHARPAPERASAPHRDEAYHAGGPARRPAAARGRAFSWRARRSRRRRPTSITASPPIATGRSSSSFQHNEGTQRPDLIFDNVEVLNYVEWSNSTISVDGHVSNLWDNMHGYSQDDAHHQVFSTISGPGWQVIQIATLVDAHTVTVQYQFVARNQGLAVPQTITLSILHTHGSLYQPALHGATLTAGVLPGAVSNLDGGAAPAPMGA